MPIEAQEEEHDSKQNPRRIPLIVLVIFGLSVLSIFAHFGCLAGILLGILALLMALVGYLLLYSSDERPEGDDTDRDTSGQVPRLELPMNIQWNWIGNSVRTSTTDQERAEATIRSELSRQMSLPPPYEVVVGESAPGRIQPPGSRLASLLPQ